MNHRFNISRESLRRPRRRRGMLTLELILTLPILITVVLAIVQFAMLLISAQGVATAASVGAREASLPGATRASVETAIQRAVGDWRFAAHLDPVNIEINDVADPALPLSAAATGDYVAVSVSVDSTDAAPDMLKFIGLSLAGQKLRTTYVVRKE